MRFIPTEFRASLQEFEPVPWLSIHTLKPSTLRKALQEFEPGPPPVSQSIRFLPPALRMPLRGLLRGPTLSLLPFRCVLRCYPCGKGVVSHSLRSSET